MKTHGSKKNEKGIASMPLFWQVMLIVFFIVALAAAIMMASNHLLQTSLADSYMETAQNTLDWNCERLDRQLYSTTSLPGVIENSFYYSYLQNEKNGRLQRKYLSVLECLRKVLASQLYLQKDSVESALYIKGTNSICTNYMAFPRAEDCFENYIRFDAPVVPALLEKLKQKECFEFLPMQKILVGKKEGNFFAMIMGRRDSDISLMSLYTAEYIVNSLGFDSFPQGTVLRLTSKTGESLGVWPEGGGKESNTDSYQLHSRLEVLGVDVEYYIPKFYFDDKLHSMKLINGLLILLIAAVGTAGGCFFSSWIAFPATELLQAYGGQKSKGRNEFKQLGDIITQSREKEQLLRELLCSNLLARLFTGAILKQAEEDLIRETMRSVPCPWRIVFIRSEQAQSATFFILNDRKMRELEWKCVLISQTEFAVVCPDSADILDVLQKVLANLQEAVGCNIFSGVSQPLEELGAIASAYQQARFAVSPDSMLTVYIATHHNARSTISWNCHERLYTSIINGEKETAQTLLHSLIIENSTEKGARWIFYNCFFVLHSAARELDITPQSREIEYNDALSPLENLCSLDKELKNLFVKINERKRQILNDQKAGIVDWLKINLNDPNLGAAMVSAHFQMPEKKIYSTIRSVTGLSLNEYILMLRMEKAGELLCATDMNVKEIGRQCGYEAESTFYRLFKLYYGATPSEYRLGSAVKI